MSDLWKSDANWFVTWFNTPAYHALYGERDEAEAARFIQALTDQVLVENCRRVLDLGCGAGRHASAFAERGKYAVGIDLSPNSIEAARSVYGESDRLHFIEGDMRTLEENVEPDFFDAVVSAIDKCNGTAQRKWLDTPSSAVSLCTRWWLFYDLSTESALPRIRR